MRDCRRESTVEPVVCCRVLAEQAERAAKDQQTLLEHKESELRSMDEHVRLLEEQVSSLKRINDADHDELSKLRATVAELDREKDELQIAVDEKTEQEASRMDAVAARVSADVHSNAAYSFCYNVSVRLSVIAVCVVKSQKLGYLLNYHNCERLIGKKYCKVQGVGGV